MYKNTMTTMEDWTILTTTKWIILLKILSLLVYLATSVFSASLRRLLIQRLLIIIRHLLRHHLIMLLSIGKGRENANTARANASLDVDSSSSHSSSSRDSSEHVKSMVLKANATTIHCYDSCSWLADTATTSHIASEKKDFTVYRKIDRTITGVGDARVKAVGCGSVILTSHVDGETHTIALNDVLHVPSATDNLLSVGRFVERGNTFVATKFGAFLFDGNESLVATAKLDGSLFHLDVKVTHELSNVSKPVKYSWMEWHKRFGHIAVSGLQHLRRRNLVDGFDVDESSELQDCEACVRAKQTEN